MGVRIGGQTIKMIPYDGPNTICNALCGEKLQEGDIVGIVHDERGGTRFYCEECTFRIHEKMSQLHGGTGRPIKHKRKPKTT